ncbi:14458_t:CDS:1, partial [Racocetra fulgida]
MEETGRCKSQKIRLQYLPKNQYDTINNKPQIKRRLNSKQKYGNIIKFDKKGKQKEQGSMDLPHRPLNGNIIDSPSSPIGEEISETNDINEYPAPLHDDLYRYAYF